MLGLFEAAGWSKLQIDQLARLAVNTALDGAPARESAVEVLFSTARFSSAHDDRVGTKTLQAVKLRDHGAGWVIFKSEETMLDAGPRLWNVDISLGNLVGLPLARSGINFLFLDPSASDEGAACKGPARCDCLCHQKGKSAGALYIVKLKFNIDWAAGEFSRVARNTSPHRAEALLSTVLGGSAAGILSMAFHVYPTNAPMWHDDSETTRYV
jgi:hypothetical protein